MVSIPYGINSDELDKIILQNKTLYRLISSYMKIGKITDYTIEGSKSDSTDGVIVNKNIKIVFTDTHGKDHSLYTQIDIDLQYFESEQELAEHNYTEILDNIDNISLKEHYTKTFLEPWAERWPHLVL